MKKFFCILIFFFINLSLNAGRKEGPGIRLFNNTDKEIVFLSEHNGKNIRKATYRNHMEIIVNNEVHYFTVYDPLLYIECGRYPLSPEYSTEIFELPYYEKDFDACRYISDYFLIFSKGGNLLKRIDDIVENLEIVNSGNALLTVNETAPIASVPLNYPAIPEDYQTDSYYIKNNTDELVYVVAPDYIGVPHPDAGTLEEDESIFIPSQQVTNGLSFYRELYPGESFYLGKAAHPKGQKYAQSASEGFNEYLPLIYLVTPEMNVLYRLENFENYEFTETSDTDGKKIELELQEEMSMRHTDMWTKYKLDF